MRKLLLMATAAVGLAAAAPAYADSITLNAIVNGTLVDSINSPDGTLNVNDTSFGPDFDLNTLTINSAQFLAPPAVLNTNTLNVNQNVTGNNTLVLDITANGITGNNQLESILSEFSVTEYPRLDCHGADLDQRGDPVDHPGVHRQLGLG